MAAFQHDNNLNKTSINAPILHLDVTRTWDKHALPVSSLEWKQARADILARHNNTCSSCGYTPPDSARGGLKIDYKDGDASNNHPSNHRVQCPPCAAIRHCGLFGIKGYIILRSSDLDQLDIVQRTREAFERSGTIPPVTELDPHATHPGPDMSIDNFAELLLETKWDDLPVKYRKFKGFFTPIADQLFSATNSKFDGQFHSDSSVRAEQIHNLESSLPSMTFSPEEHSSLQNFLNDWRPSTTRLFEYALIRVTNPKFIQEGFPDISGLKSAWDVLCADQCATAEKLDDLARQYHVLGGKWLIFLERDKVDARWWRIACSTHAGTLGTSAQVTPIDESSDDSRHLICVFTKNYTDLDNVKRVRESLRRLGVRHRIGYKPDAFTHCAIYSHNPWNIQPSKYQM